MKYFKIILILVVVSLALQAGGLYALEKIYFKSSSEFKIEKVESKPVEANINIPETSKNINISSTGRYISYFEGDDLFVANTKTGEKDSVVIDNSKEILYCDWIENVNRLILLVRSKSNMVELYTYDANSKTQHYAKEITSYSNSMSVEGMAISTKSGVKYIALAKGGNATPTIYRVDINETVTKISNSVKEIGDMTAFQNKDILIYKDKNKKLFYSYTNGKTTKIDLKVTNEVDILGTDGNGNVYFGEYEGDKISRIIYGELETKDGNWKSVSLEEKKLKSDIFITESGEILVNNSLKGEVLNLSTKTSTSYEGKFVQVNNKVICSMYEDKIYVKSISEVDKEK